MAGLAIDVTHADTRACDIHHAEHDRQMKTAGTGGAWIEHRDPAVAADEGDVNEEEPQFTGGLLEPAKGVEPSDLSVGSLSDAQRARFDAVGKQASRYVD